MTKDVFISLGSNLGDRDQNLLQAIEILSAHKGINLEKSSKTINTPAYGKTNQPDFLNMVIEISTSLSPHELLQVCMRTEDEMKRVRIERWGPRIIDVDILLYEDHVVEEPNLTIPHYDMHNRGFVLIPMNEIAPKTVHPLLDKSMSDLLENLGKN